MEIIPDRPPLKTYTTNVGDIHVAVRSDGGDVGSGAVGDPEKNYTASFENVAGQQVHVVGDGDKYVVSNVAVGGSIGSHDAIPIAGIDDTGKLRVIRVDSDGYILTKAG